MKEYIETLIDKIAEKTAEKLADHIIKRGLLTPPVFPQEGQPEKQPYPYPWDGIAVMYGVQTDRTTYKYDTPSVTTNATIDYKEL